MQSNSGTSSKGFTLIEVIVSITIMAMLSVVVLSALRSGLLIRDKGTSRIESIRKSRTVRGILAEQIRGALPMTYTDRSTFPLAFEGDRRHIRFVSRTSFKDGPDGVPRWVDLRWLPEPSQQSGELVVEERRILPPDNTPDSAVYWRGSLFQGRDCSFDFLTDKAGNQPRSWIADWRYPTHATLPQAVRINCVSSLEKDRSVLPLDYAESSAAGLTIQ